MSHAPFIISSKALKDHLDNFGCTALGRSETFAGMELRGVGHGISVSTPPNWRDEWFARLSSAPIECKLPRGFEERYFKRKRGFMNGPAISGIVVCAQGFKRVVD